MIIFMTIMCIMAMLAVLYIVSPLWHDHKMVFTASMISTVLLSFYLYQKIGDMTGYQKLLLKADEQKVLEQSQQLLKNPQEVIERLEKHMQAHPDSAKGWYLLGRLYTATQQYHHALIAFKKSLTFDRENPDIIFNTIQALYWESKQHRTAEINKHIQHLKQINKNYLPTYLFIAADAAKHGHHKTAIKNWRIVVEHLPVGSKEQTQILKLIAHSQQPSTTVIPRFNRGIQER